MEKTSRSVPAKKHEQISWQYEGNDTTSNQKTQSVQKHVKAITDVFDDLSIKEDQLNEENQVVYVLASLSELYILVAVYPSWKSSSKGCYMNKSNINKKKPLVLLM